MVKALAGGENSVGTIKAAGPVRLKRIKSAADALLGGMGTVQEAVFPLLVPTQFHL